MNYSYIGTDIITRGSIGSSHRAKISHTVPNSAKARSSGLKGKYVEHIQFLLTRLSSSFSSIRIYLPDLFVHLVTWIRAPDRT